MNGYKQPGNIADYVNTSGADLAVGAVVVIGARIGVCETAIPNGSTGSIRVREVVSLPKKAGDTPAQGALVYWDATDGYITTNASGNTLAGYAFRAAVSADATVDVHLNA